MSITEINEISNAIKLLEEYINEVNIQLERFYKLMGEAETQLEERLEFIEKNIEIINEIFESVKQYNENSNIKLQEHSLGSIEKVVQEIQSITATAKDIKTLKILQDSYKDSYSKEDLEHLKEHREKYKNSMSELLQKVNGISNNVSNSKQDINNKTIDNKLKEERDSRAELACAKLDERLEQERQERINKEWLKDGLQNKKITDITPTNQGQKKGSFIISKLSAEKQAIAQKLDDSLFKKITPISG